MIGPQEDSDVIYHPGTRWWWRVVPREKSRATTAGQELQLQNYITAVVSGGRPG